ncbi:MAG TPA: nicotinate (nicotinamide) nucleotide adenylyltransferase [Draconibacterium sp.]|nr:nicotinate (nicotinamide) nucleotide adenylyltransferase [Draconibacterium sp.]
MNNLVTDILAPKSTLHLKIGLYFGTFNPIHIGHMAIASFIVDYADIDELWFVVSPQNPHKKKQNLLNDYHRLEMVHRAVDNDNRFRVSNIEFSLPKPSYTIDTLSYLKDQFPKHHFKIIMGSDNLEKLHKWKNYEQIVENFGIIIYPRPGFEPSKYELPSTAEIANAPQMDISSTFIRKAIHDGKDVRHFLPQKTWEYLDEMNFYRK